MEHLGIGLKLERKRLGLIQEALARAGGVESNAQCNYERGQRYPRADYLQKVLKAGVDVLFVLSGEVSSPLLFGHALQPSLSSRVALQPASAGLPEQVSVLLGHLSENLRTTALAIAEVAQIASGQSGGEDDGVLADHLHALEDNSERFVQMALYIARPSNLNS